MGSDPIDALERKPGQSIKIGDDIEIHFLDVKGKKQIKVGIQAPTEKAIHRNDAKYITD